MPVRSFRVSDSPARASQVISHMSVRDAGSLPPGVSATKIGTSSFEARGPLGTSVRAQLSVRGDGRGGAIVTETYRGSSAIPFGGRAAEAIHGAATDPRIAYGRASRRT